MTRIDQDFKNFSTFADDSAPVQVEQLVLKNIKSKLEPSQRLILFKLILIQGFIGFLTLTFCPQFKFSLTHNYDLFHYFHNTYGEYICMSFCGGIFLSSGAFFSFFVLSSDEVQKIRKSHILYHLSTSIFFLSFFLLIGAEFYLGMNLFWILGATVSSYLVFEINHFIKSKALLT